MNRSRVFSIADSSRVGDARREAVLLAQDFGFDETETGKIGLIVTEAANNLVKHARGGQVILRQLRDADVNGLEVLAVDRGPGMVDVAKCLKDGYSTAGSPGTGLGAISRLAAYFEIHSEPGKGTVLLAQMWSGLRRGTTDRLVLGVVCAPLQDQDACGDAWSVRHEGDRTQVLVVDGLGHGPLAARAADEAVRVFEAGGWGSGVELLRDLHGALRSTRGASLAIAEIHYSSNTLRYTGVGNISGVVWARSTSRNMVSHNGTVGHELHRVQEFVYPWSETAMLVMHSDGIVSRWNLDAYPGLLHRHPSIIAAVLFRDYSRARDDVTALVGRDFRADPSRQIGG